MASELELCDTEELINELARRFDGMILGTLSSITDSKEATCYWYRGGRIQALGLAQEAQMKMIDWKSVIPEVE